MHLALKGLKALPEQAPAAPKRVALCPNRSLCPGLKPLREVEDDIDGREIHCFDAAQTAFPVQDPFEASCENLDRAWDLEETLREPAET